MVINIEELQHPVKKKTNGIHCLQKLVIKCNQTKNKAKINTPTVSVPHRLIDCQDVINTVWHSLSPPLPPPFFLHVKLCIANEQRRNWNPVIPIDITPTTRFLLDFLGLLQGSLCKRDEAKRKLYAGASFVTGEETKPLVCLLIQLHVRNYGLSLFQYI